LGSSKKKRNFFQKSFASSEKVSTFAVPFDESGIFYAGRRIFEIHFFKAKEGESRPTQQPFGCEEGEAKPDVGIGKMCSKRVL